MSNANLIKNYLVLKVICTVKNIKRHLLNETNGVCYCSHTVDLSQSQTDWLQCVEGKSAQKTGIFKDQMSLRGTHGLITCLVQSGKYPFSPSGATIVQNTVLEFRRQICVHNSAFHYDRFILQDPTKKDSKRHDLNDSKQF